MMTVTRPGARLAFGFLLLMLAVALAACGSSGGTAGTAQTTSAGTTGFSRGVVTGTGSIHFGADDRIFLTSGTTIRKRLDDNAVNLAGDDNTIFRKGMVVEVFHNSNDNHAIEVRFKDDLEGPITSIAGVAPNLTLTVFGVTVVTDNNTQFDDSLDDHAPTGLTLATLAVGNLIEVSGLFDNAGVLHATFIESQRTTSAGRTFEIKGNVAGLTGAAPNQLFTVNGVGISTDNTTQLKDLPATGLANGLFVEVKSTDNGATLPIHATRIEGTFEDPDHEVEAAQEASVEGFVKGLVVSGGTATFTLAGTSVSAASTITGFGLIAPNAHIEAEGPVVGGVIQARIIRLRP